MDKQQRNNNTKIIKSHSQDNQKQYLDLNIYKKEPKVISQKILNKKNSKTIPKDKNEKLNNNNNTFNNNLIKDNIQLKNFSKENNITHSKMDCNNKIKRKAKISKLKTKNNRKRIIEHIKKNIYKLKDIFSIMDGELDIIPEETDFKKFDIDTDEIKLKEEEIEIAKFSKKNNEDFIKRIKENNNFIKKNNIIINDEVKEEKKDNSKQKQSSYKLKLYQFKGLYLNKK